jgi:predicted N-acetyltransferase YhbS
VGALAAVCVHPDNRGRGWGAAVVRAAFDFLPEMGASIALFQTGVPRFYEKLSARQIANRFYDGSRTDSLERTRGGRRT